MAVGIKGKTCTYKINYTRIDRAVKDSSRNADPKQKQPRKVVDNMITNKSQTLKTDPEAIRIPELILTTVNGERFQVNLSLSGRQPLQDTQCKKHKIDRNEPEEINRANPTNTKNDDASERYHADYKIQTASLSFPEPVSKKKGLVNRVRQQRNEQELKPNTQIETFSTLHAENGHAIGISRVIGQKEDRKHEPDSVPIMSKLSKRVNASPPVDAVSKNIYNPVIEEIRDHEHKSEFPNFQNHSDYSYAVAESHHHKEISEEITLPIKLDLDENQLNSKNSSYPRSKLTHEKGNMFHEYNRQPQERRGLTQSEKSLLNSCRRNPDQPAIEIPVMEERKYEEFVKIDRNTKSGNCEIDRPERNACTQKSPPARSVQEVNTSRDTIHDEKCLLDAQKKDGIIKILLGWMETETKPSWKSITRADTGRLKRSRKSLRKYYNRFEKLNLQRGILMIKEPRTSLQKNQLKFQKTTNRICLPTSLMEEVFDKAHTHELAGHPGRDRTQAQIEDQYYHPLLRKWVQAKIDGCVPCQKNGPKMKRFNTAPKQDFSIQISRFNDVVHSDYKGPIHPSSDDKTMVLAIVDAATKYTMLIPTESKKAEVTNQAIHDNWTTVMGAPRRLVTDQGSEFTNKSVLGTLNQTGSEFAPRIAWNPQSNGTVENRMRTIMDTLRKYLKGRFSEWSHLIKEIEYAMNCTPNTTTGQTPYEMVFNRKPPTPVNQDIHIQTRLEDADDIEGLAMEKFPETSRFIKSTSDKNNKMLQAYMINRRNKDMKEFDQDKKCLGLPLEVGSLVFWHNKKPTQSSVKISRKLREKRQGPLKILSIIPPVTYVCKDLQTNATHKANRDDLSVFKPFDREKQKLLAESNDEIYVDNTVTPLPPDLELPTVPPQVNELKLSPRYASLNLKK
jgi:hypothetical protein